MKAVITTKHGSSEFLQVQEIDKPIPKDNEVLIKVYASTVTAGDIIMRKAGFPLRLLLRMLGFQNKKIPGTEFSGVIEAVGKNVTHFKIGDEVFGTTTGLAVGSASEFICLPEKWKKGIFIKKSSSSPATTWGVGEKRKRGRLGKKPKKAGCAALSSPTGS